MPTLECPGNSIHRYNEEEDYSRCHPLSNELIGYLNNNGIYIEEKIGEGSSADVFKVSMSNGVKAALIIPTNTESRFDSTAELIEATKFPDIFPIIYSYFNVDIPYSSDEKYLEISKDFGERTIQVIELMEMTLDQYIIEAVETYKSNVWSLVDSIVTIIKHHILELYNNGIYYTDLKLDNIGVVYNNSEANIKFIDIEGIRFSHSWEYKFNPEETVEDLLTYEIIPVVETELLEYNLQ